MIDRCMLQCAAWLTPPEDREEWLAEWTSELWYVSERSNWEAVRFCLGAFKDAFWLRRNATKTDLRPMCWFRSPAQCLAFLAAFAAVSAFFAFRWPVPIGIMQRAMLYRDILFADIGTILFAIAILPATTRLALGEYPVTVHSPSRAKRLGRWIFFLVKLVLIIPAVFFGTLDLAQILCPAGMQPHATLIGYILAFRWALTDQRQRCPVCLRLLSNPMRIGQASQTLLEWYGTEFVCDQGHGLLHVPEIPTISYRTQRWLYLDPSWRSLFS